MIYLDNAATQLQKPDCVTNAVIDAMKNAGNPGRGEHFASMYASRMVFQARETAANLLGARDPARIAFTKNVTEALNIAIGCIPDGAHVITSVTEHNSVLRPLYRRKSIQLSYIGADADGCLDYDQLRTLLRPDTRAIVITHASNVTGRITDIKWIAAWARAHGLLLIVDGAQAAGAVPVRVEEDGIDIYCFTGHKGLMGPQGTGGLYVREGIDPQPLIVGGSGNHSFAHEQPQMMPEVLEAGTLNTHGIVGLDAGMQYVTEIGPEKILEHERRLAEQFIRKTFDIDGIRYYGWKREEIAAAIDGRWGDRTHIGIVSLNVGEEDAAWITDELWRKYGICVRAGAHCAPLIHEHFGTREQGMVRFSFSWFNTPEEVEEAASALRYISKSNKEIIRAPFPACNSVSDERFNPSWEEGMLVSFGSFPYESDGTGKALTWRVLERKGDRALIRTDKAIERIAYNEKRVPVSWKECTLRQWLNQRFINAAFTGEERAAIIDTEVSAHFNPGYNTPQGEDTIDRVFILSLQEEEKYVPNDEERRIFPTPYAKSKRAYLDADGHCWVWLRNMGQSTTDAARVYNTGALHAHGIPVDIGNTCVQPALWVDLTKMRNLF